MNRVSYALAGLAVGGAVLAGGMSFTAAPASANDPSNERLQWAYAVMWPVPRDIRGQFEGIPCGTAPSDKWTCAVKRTYLAHFDRHDASARQTRESLTRLGARSGDWPLP